MQELIPPIIPGATLTSVEDYTIFATLESVDWSTTRAAAILNCSIRKLQYKIRTWRGEKMSFRKPVDGQQPQRRSKNTSASAPNFKLIKLSNIDHGEIAGYTSGCRCLDCVRAKQQEGASKRRMTNAANKVDAV